MTPEDVTDEMVGEFDRLGFRVLEDAASPPGHDTRAMIAAAVNAAGAVVLAEGEVVVPADLLRDLLGELATACASSAFHFDTPTVEAKAQRLESLIDAQRSSNP